MSTQQRQLNLLNLSDVRKITKTLIDYINNNCPCLPDNLEIDYQFLKETDSLSIQDLPNGIKLKEYLDGVSYNGQYNFALYYKTNPQDTNERLSAINVLDSICEWLESIETIDFGTSTFEYHYINQTQCSHLFSRSDDGYLIYQSILTLNYSKWGN